MVNFEQKSKVPLFNCTLSLINPTNEKKQYNRRLLFEFFEEWHLYCWTREKPIYRLVDRCVSKERLEVRDGEVGGASELVEGGRLDLLRGRSFRAAYREGARWSLWRVFAQSLRRSEFLCLTTAAMSLRSTQILSLSDPLFLSRAQPHGNP